MFHPRIIRQPFVDETCASFSPPRSGGSRSRDNCLDSRRAGITGIIRSLPIARRAPVTVQRDLLLFLVGETDLERIRDGELGSR